MFQAVRKARTTEKEMKESKQLSKDLNLIALNNYLSYRILWGHGHMCVFGWNNLCSWLLPRLHYPPLTHSLLHCSGFNKKWCGQCAYKSEIIETIMVHYWKIWILILLCLFNLKLRKLLSLISISYCPGKSLCIQNNPFYLSFYDSYIVFC